MQPFQGSDGIECACSQTQHYIEGTDTCESNVCSCIYGEVTDSCTKHNTHSCKDENCNSHENDCVQPCQKTLLMDSSWFRPVTAEEVYWKINNNNDAGYTFFEAVNYCRNLGSYVSLPSKPEYLEQIFNYNVSETSTWIGLSKFGLLDKPFYNNSDSACSEENEIRWERNDEFYVKGEGFWAILIIIGAHPQFWV